MNYIDYRASSSLATSASSDKVREKLELQKFIQTANARLAQLNETQQPAEETRTWSYYENLRKTNKTVYADPKTQAQMFRDRMELGESFNDGTFDKDLGNPR
jgi:hypothetical protein